MSDFLEGARKRTPSNASGNEAGDAVNRAAQRLGYSEAVLAELSQSLVKISALEIKERATKSSLDRAKQKLDLAQQLKRLLAKRPAASRRELEDAEREEGAAERQVRECRDAYDPIADELQRLTWAVAKRDAELRRQFGISETG